MNNILAVLIGLSLRLIIPIAVTVLIVYLLHKLDERWQMEALQQSQLETTTQVECWKIQNCPPEQYKECPAYATNQPCWQVHRLHNGYLREECLTCAVFRTAPIPAHAS